MKIIKLEEGKEYSCPPETVLYYGIDLDLVFDLSVQQYRAKSLTGLSFNIVNDNIDDEFISWEYYSDNANYCFSEWVRTGRYSEDY